jgi:peptidyl-prolyl cis-trans isomerase A (cyclophilin A)
MLQPLSFLWLLAILANITANDESRPLVVCQTTKGPIKIEVYSEWAPLGAQRFLELVKDNFYTNIALFRCVERFLVQFGISEDPTKKHWHRADIPDDPNLNLGIKKHYVSYAGGGPNTRSTQLFIAFEDLDFLGHEPWETPFGKKNHCLFELLIAHAILREGN